MGKLNPKFYALNPFPDKFLAHQIRHSGWILKAKLQKDRDLEKMLEDAIIRLRHLSHLAEADMKSHEEHKAVSGQITAIRTRIKKCFEEIRGDLNREIKEVKKVDYRGQTFAFRELKDVRRFEKSLGANLLFFAHKLKITAKSEAERFMAETRLKEAMEQVEARMHSLDRKVEACLRMIWDLAKKQAIDGIQLKVAIDTEHVEKLVRLEKVMAKQIVDLAKESKAKIKVLNRLKKNGTLEQYVQGIKDLIQIYDSEITDVYQMMLKHRILVYDLWQKFGELAKLAQKDQLDRITFDDLKLSLHNALMDVESLSNWLYHEARKEKIYHMGNGQEGWLRAA